MICAFNIRSEYDDAFQEALILLYDSFLKYNTDSRYPFYSYFKKCLRNRLIDFKKKYYDQTITYESDENLSILKEETELDYHSNIILPLDILTAKQKKVLELRYFENKSPKEIAEIYGVSITNIYSTIHTAKTKLRSRYYEENDQF